MKTYITCALCLFAVAIHAVDDENDNLLVSKGSMQTFKNERKTITSGVNKAEAEQMMSMNKKKAMAASQGTSDVMIVDPKVVSQDWVDAFHKLQTKRATRLAFVLSNNETITNIEDVEALPGGYLCLFTVRTIHGVSYKIVKTSEIQTLTSL